MHRADVKDTVINPPCDNTMCPSRIRVGPTTYHVEHRQYTAKTGIGKCSNKSEHLIWDTTAAVNSIDHYPEDRAPNCCLPFGPAGARHSGIVAPSSPYVRRKQVCNLVLLFNLWSVESSPTAEQCLGYILDFRTSCMAMGDHGLCDGNPALTSRVIRDAEPPIALKGKHWV